jgi:hypothetical protein
MLLAHTDLLELVHDLYAHDRQRWGDGAWKREPDRCQWVDATTGFQCLALRDWRGQCADGLMSGTGAWWGFVGMDERHPLTCRSSDHPAFEFAPVPVTWHGFDHEEAERDPRKIGFEPPYRSDLWMVGFGMTNFSDLCPAVPGLYSYGRPIYRTLADVRVRCTSLAHWLARFPSN